VKIAGNALVSAHRERAYALLQDPAVLARCMPGCEGLDPAGDGEYAMRLKLVLASMSGMFQGKVRVADTNPPDSFRLIVEGAGKIGFMKGDGVLTLAEQPLAGRHTASGGPACLEATATRSSQVTEQFSETAVHFEGDVQVGGTIAAVGQRLIEATAKVLIKRFFDRLCQEAAALH
jgi:carbon monoxide dehydrogenase subunit G